jgi:hypothetical protein
MAAMVCRRLVCEAAVWPRPVAMAFAARGLRTAASGGGSLRWRWKTAGVVCRSSGLGVRAHGSVGGRECGELILGIETSCDDTGAAVVMHRFLCCLCIQRFEAFDVVDLRW